jgi:hypothetical protein
MSEKRKHQLHEILAVLADLEGEAKKVREEAIVTFTKKTNHFMGHHKTLKMFDEDRAMEQEGAEEHKPLVTTVDKKLSYLSKSQAKYYDVILQQESTNQNARADLVVEGKVIAEQLPATFLLGMESRLKALRAVFDAIPTLDPSLEWEKDTIAGNGSYKSTHPETTQKQEKTMVHKVLVDPTKEHPAQIREWAENKTVGTYILQKSSGMITPAKKSEYLGRVDLLLRATKKARQRANSQEIVKARIGEKLFSYIMEGI